METNEEKSIRIFNSESKLHNNTINLQKNNLKAFKMKTRLKLDFSPAENQTHQIPSLNSPNLEILDDLRQVIQKSRFLKNLEKISLKQEDFKDDLKTPRVIPSQSKEIKFNVRSEQTSKSQRVMLAKGQFFDKKIISELKFNQTPIKISSFVRDENFFNNRRNSPFTHAFSSNHSKLGYKLKKRGDASMILPENSGLTLNSPLLYRVSSKVKSESPKKYYRDTPLIIKNSKVPKDIFVFRKLSD
jgi:hypothetical protein